MRFSGQTLFFIAAIILLTIAAPRTIFATMRIVMRDSAQCPSETATTRCYTNLSDAMVDAVAGDSIEIRPGTYTGNFNVTKGVSIYGNETARTFLSGGGSGAVLTVDGATNAMSIRRLTFINAGSGILIRNSTSSVEITNNIFQVGSNGTAIQTTASPTATITNNTFHRNRAGIASDTNSLTITNNIFFQNGDGIAIAPNTMALASIKNNLFFGGTVGPAIITVSGDQAWLGNITEKDPLFVDPDQVDFIKRDFHLKSGTPCRDAGDTATGTDSIDGSAADMGAYGGPTSDTIPFPVSGLFVTGQTTSTVSLGWQPNLCYLIGGYTIYYGTISSSYTTTVDAGNLTAFDISGLAPASSPTGTPHLTNDVKNETLRLSWDASTVSGATGYEIRYDTLSSPPLPPLPAVLSKDAGIATSYPLSNLQNGIYYHVIMIPYSQTTHYFAIQAYYASNKSFLSTYSNEEHVGSGEKMFGAPSNEIYDYPEALVSYPNLQNSRRGCFIATAAYSSPFAPEVQVLRAFRDHYLLTNNLGSAFVRWYYEHGPVAAAWLEAHPEYKPAVRTALMPAVGLAFFMTGAPFFIKTVAGLFLLVMSLITSFLIWRILFSNTGGDQ